jgi:hypothetical protein
MPPFLSSALLTMGASGGGMATMWIRKVSRSEGKYKSKTIMDVNVHNKAVKSPISAYCGQRRFVSFCEDECAGYKGKEWERVEYHTKA